MAQPASNNGDPTKRQPGNRRGDFRHIVLPMLVALAIVVTGLALIILSGTAGIARAADVSLVLLGLLALLLCLIPIAALFASIFGLNWLLRTIPNYTQIASNFSQRVVHISEQITQRVSKIAITAVMGFSVTRWFMGNNKQDEDDSTTE